MSQVTAKTIARIGCLVALLAAPLPQALAAPPPSRDELYDALIARSGEQSADARIAYGSAPQQFGELWLPAGTGKAPVIVLVHGGCWLKQLPGLEFLHQMAGALREKGYAVWSIEYRRLGEDGGGYPGTFLDVAHGADHVRQLAQQYPLDLARVIAVGHSVGGSMAMWLAGRHNLSRASPLFSADPLHVDAVVNVAGPADLEQFAPHSPAVCMPGMLETFFAKAERSSEVPFADTSPAALLPLGARQVLAYGIYDPAVPPYLGKQYLDTARAKGEAVRLINVPDAGHFDLIAPWTPAWPVVADAIDELTKNMAPKPH
jgi:acetyl esterase/lipase